MTGTVRVKLYKGNIICAGRKSPVSLYNPAHRHDGSRPDQSLQPGRRDGIYQVEWIAAESRGTGAWREEEMTLSQRLLLV